MSKSTINAIAITSTKEFITLHNQRVSLYNSLMERLSKQDKAHLQELVDVVVEYERLFVNAVQVGKDRHAQLYSVKGAQ